jgi:hypothetical protein
VKKTLNVFFRRKKTLFEDGWGLMMDRTDHSSSRDIQPKYQSDEEIFLFFGKHIHTNVNFSTENFGRLVAGCQLDPRSRGFDSSQGRRNLAFVFGRNPVSLLFLRCR